jgi:glycosyltransferase involved in cell wall biosynthesis
MRTGAERPTRMRVLAFAYACEPECGSEPGAGWNWARMLAQLAETVVITRTVFRPAIETALQGSTEESLPGFVYVDLPPWTSGGRREPIAEHLYYLLWQVAALRRARSLHRERPFQLVWHLTLASVWFGSVAALVGPPLVYGPVGGGTHTPMRLLPSLGVRGALYELLRSGFHLLERHANPLAALTLGRAELILVQNEETLRRLSPQTQAKAEIFSNAVAVSSAVHSRPPDDGRPTALFAGQLLAFKGVGFAIRALAKRPRWRLLICGAGPDISRLQRLAERVGVRDRVSFLGWQPRSEVIGLLRDQADIFVFPSLHDEAGLAVVEALSAGLAVICADQGGPPLLAGPAARRVSTRRSSKHLVEELTANLRPTTRSERSAAYTRSGELLPDARVVALAEILNRRLRPRPEFSLSSDQGRLPVIRQDGIP